MENRQWLAAFLRKVVESFQNPEVIGEICRDYESIKQQGKETELNNFIRNEYREEKDIYFACLNYLYQIIGDSKLYIMCAQAGLELEPEKEENLFLELNLIEQIYSMQFQIGVKDFQFAWRWNHILSEKMEKALSANYAFIPVKERRKDRVVLVVPQLLSPIHAPTRLILEFARNMITVLKKEVLLVVSVIHGDLEMLAELNLASGAAYNNYNEEYNGKFSVEYRGAKINGYQILLEEENMSEMKLLMDSIYAWKPFLVWNFAANTSYVSVMKKFTTYIHTECSGGYPPVEADIIVNYIEAKGEEDRNNKKYLEAHGITVKEIKFLFPYQKPWSKITKKDYGMPESAFGIGIVGNRLMQDCSLEFIQVIGQIVKDIREAYIIFYGSVGDEFKLRVQNCIEDAERVIYVGEQRDLINYLGIMDVFLNPPRLGGGNGAAMSMSLGKPVITTEKGDVAAVAGEAFIAGDMNEFLPLIKKYQTDHTFYNKQSKLAAQIIADMTTSDEELADILQQIFDMVG